MRHPNLNEEKRLWKMGYRNVAGLDEAGRGPLAGPVTASAVIFNSGFKIKDFKFLNGINDSKKLSQEKREELFKIITKNKDIKWGVGIVSEKIIDKINIKNASELAMEKAVKKLKLKPDFLIIDGNNIKNLKLKSYNLKLIIGGDAKVFSCAAASILAKVARDRFMVKYHKKHPEYKFDVHKGYPTKLHIKLIKKYGLSKIHRKTFSPCRDLQ
jgi:ribonuclease HII